jgi:hypothetical protein
MDYAVVPAEVGTHDARIWVGGIVDSAADPADVWLEHQASGTRWPVDGWDRWQEPDGARSLRHQRVHLTGLAQSTRYPLELRVAGQVRAHADTTTLPAALPGLNDPPFIVLLGSCFCRAQDASGRVGRTLAQLPGGAKPTVNFLVGDQVYLDSPWYRFTYPRSNDALARGFFDQYVSPGPSRATRRGSITFSDPVPRTSVPTTTSSGTTRRSPAASPRIPGRMANAAQALYRAFQTTGSRVAFRVGELEFMLLDSRLNRDRDRQAFLSPVDFAAFESWIAGLTGPGVLVLGQPVFADRAGIRGERRRLEPPGLRAIPRALSGPPR